ncbi:MAG: CapA family protein [Lachnospiraceae bacterium]|jgi:poly-gamma-glutamate capsule biosynthesis protein CapA/YwtB (metallophosphatase superfamily)
MNQRKPLSSGKETKQKNRKPEYNLEYRRQKQARMKKFRVASIIAAAGAILILLSVIVSTVKKELAFRFTKDGESILYDTGDSAGSTGATQADILSAGDVILHAPIFESNHYHKDHTYDFSPIFQYIKKDYEASDFTVVNLESTLAYDNYSSYPLFRVPSEIAPALKENGVDMCLLANNHLYDNKEDGISMTMETLDQHSLLCTGIRREEAEPAYLIQNVNSIKIGILNYAAETGASSEKKLINDIPVSEETAPLINSFNYNELEAFYASVQKNLEKMKFMDVAFTIVYLHWGDEYSLTENEYQRTIAQKLCDMGINAVIGSHPHVVQPVDVLTSKEGDHQMLCVYSVGNHFSNQRRDLMNAMPKGHTEDGLMVNLTIERSEEGTVSITNVDFIPTWVYRSEDGDNFEYFILPADTSKKMAKGLKKLNCSEEMKASCKRTNEIIKEGTEKIAHALPIQ